MKIKSGLILAVAAGSIAGVANGAERDITGVELEVAGQHRVNGYVYINMSTGEKVISYDTPQTSAVVRGSSWAWNNSIVDPCAPEDIAPEDESVAVFTGVASQPNGEAGLPEGINYWQDWFEAPADTIVNGMSFAYFSQIEDPEQDGVDGSDFLFTFTESDRIGDRSSAIAHSPILVEGLLGGLDDGAGGEVAGDGVIGFQEGGLWVTFLDFAGADTPFDIEIGDSNGVSDGNFGVDSVFSGVPGVDLSPTDGTDVLGEGLMNCGFVIGYRVPNVSEGDGLITIFPELAGIGLENPDGPSAVPSTFANVLPMGTGLVGPSRKTDTYVGMEGVISLWPADGVTLGDINADDAIGSWDGFSLYNAVGTNRNAPGESFYFGGFACDPAATASPFYTNPYATWWIAFNVDLVGGPTNPGCTDADVAAPFDVLDLADINAFITGFQAQDPIADLALPTGVWDLADINLFVTSFLGGCL